MAVVTTDASGPKFRSSEMDNCIIEELRRGKRATDTSRAACGFSYGKGAAESMPYCYFEVIAKAGVEDFSPRSDVWAMPGIHGTIRDWAFRDFIDFTDSIDTDWAVKDFRDFTTSMDEEVKITFFREWIKGVMSFWNEVKDKLDDESLAEDDSGSVVPPDLPF